MFSAAMLLTRVAIPPDRSSTRDAAFQAPQRSGFRNGRLGADTGSGVLIGEEFENQLTHPLFIFWPKF